MRILLAASVALNLLFLAGIVVARVDPVAQSAAGFSATGATLAEDTRSAESIPVDSVRDLVSRLERSLLAPNEVRLVVKAWLERQFKEELELSGPAFWEREYSAELEALSHETGVGDRLRQELINLYGPAAIDLPEFRDAFNPLGPAYDFLSSQAQLDLQQQHLEFVTQANGEFRNSAHSAEPCGLREWANRSGNAYGEPGARLGAPDKIELMLRVSPLADLLRKADAADDESSFRDLFALFLALEERTDAQSQVALRREIRQRFGDVAFDRIWSERDPLFGPLDQHLRGAGFTAQQALSVYTVINRGQEALMDAISGNSSDEARLAAIGRIRTAEAAELVRLLGTDQTNALQAIMHDAAVHLSKPAAATC